MMWNKQSYPRSCISLPHYPVWSNGMGDAIQRGVALPERCLIIRLGVMDWAMQSNLELPFPWLVVCKPKSAHDL